MPAGVFKPYAGVATAALIFQKGGSTKSVWFYEMTADGYSLTDTRTPVDENDIPDILQKWHSREEGVHSFRVSRDELAKHDDELTPGRYREKHAPPVEHDKPDEIYRRYSYDRGNDCRKVARSAEETSPKMKRQRAPLGELCTLVKGTSPISKTSPGPYPLVTTGEEHKTADSFQLNAEAVCIPLISSTGHGHASLKRVHYQSGKFALANLLAAALVRDRSVFSARFLARYLMFTKDRLIVPLMTGAANMSISLDRLATVPIEFPPLAEQERLVKLLDEVDELQKLRVEADRRTAAVIPSLFHKMFGDPSHSWRSSTLGELVQNFRYGTSNKSTGDGKPTLRIPNVVNQAINLDDLKFVPVSDSDFERLRLMDGDLLFVRTNGNADNVGRCAVFDSEVIKAAGHDAGEFICASYLIRARLQVEQVLPIFVQHFLTSPEGRRALRARSKTSAGQFNINTEGLGTIPIPVPSVSLQKEFATRATEIRAVQVEQAASRSRLGHLFQSMLHRAFNGEL